MTIAAFVNLIFSSVWRRGACALVPPARPLRVSPKLDILSERARTRDTTLYTRSRLQHDLRSCISRNTWFFLRVFSFFLYYLFVHSLPLTLKPGALKGWRFGRAFPFWAFDLDLETESCSCSSLYNNKTLKIAPVEKHLRIRIFIFFSLLENLHVGHASKIFTKDNFTSTEPNCDFSDCDVR